ncbi:hypothetical protein LC724_16375 [Blautia sp. RD014234]|nr:hypothetical protein [Blautia parvula]
MADIRTREKVKDVRTIDRLQAATHHAKEGYVRTKEQMAEEVSGRESSLRDMPRIKWKGKWKEVRKPLSEKEPEGAWRPFL